VASAEEWEHEQNVECVVCPSCAFAFDACHTDADGGYSCPACAEAALLTERDALKKERDEAIVRYVELPERESDLAIQLHHEMNGREKDQERLVAAEATLTRYRNEVDRQLGRHLCYTSESSRERFWKAVDAALDGPKEAQ
jgi:hypothetical protein